MSNTADVPPNGIWIDKRFVPFICGGAPDDEPEAAVEVAAATPAPPQFVPADEFKTFQTNVLDRLSEMGEGIRAMRTSAPATPVAAMPAADRVTEQQFEEAVAAGDGKTVRAYIRQEKDDLKREHIDPLSSTGLDSLANLTREVVLEKLPHYKRYKKEIDASIETLPAATRLNPDVLRIMHDAVVGRHVDEITTEAREAATRTRDVEPAEGAPSRRQTRVPATDKVATVEDLAGDDGRKALGELGRGGKDEDSFARSLGYESWKDYMKKTEAYV